MKRGEIIEKIMNTCRCKDHEEAEGLLSEEMETLAELCHMGQLRVQDFELACARLGLPEECETYFYDML